MDIPPNAAALARLLVLQRTQSEAGLSLDGYDRWGHGGAYAEKEAHEELLAQRPETTRAVAKLVKRMRKTDPGGLDYFVRARLQLYDAFLARVDPDSTEHFVGARERAGWEAFAAGGEPVDENCFYVQFDPTLFERVYGFSMWSA